MKVVFKIMGVITGLFLLLFTVALVSEREMRFDYREAFNAFRVENQISTVGEFDHRSTKNWSDHIEGSSIFWGRLFSNKDIAGIDVFENDTLSVPFQLRKTIFYGTYLGFWNNFYAGERDEYLVLCGDTTIKLEKTYLSDAMMSGGQFICKIDTIVGQVKHRMVCGGTDKNHEENEIFGHGNVDKTTFD